jgi:hypothetical protein
MIRRRLTGVATESLEGVAGFLIWVNWRGLEEGEDVDVVGFWSVVVSVGCVDGWMEGVALQIKSAQHNQQTHFRTIVSKSTQTFLFKMRYIFLDGVREAIAAAAVVVATYASLSHCSTGNWNAPKNRTDLHSNIHTPFYFLDTKREWVKREG